MQNPSSAKRAGDEFYTKSETVIKLISIYDYLFSTYDYIWLPFNCKDKPMYAEFVKKYGQDKILLTPNECYNSELGLNDFWNWTRVKSFYEKIIKHKSIVFDNVPFSISTKIIKNLKENFVDFIIFSDSMTALNKVNSTGVGYHILGRVPFDNCEETKRVNISLFSNLFTEIKYVFGVGADKLDNACGAMAWSDRVNIPKYISRGGEIGSAEVINVCARGYIFYLNRIVSGKKSKKFGGGMFYKF